MPSPLLSSLRPSKAAAPDCRQEVSPHALNMMLAVSVSGHELPMTVVTQIHGSRPFPVLQEREWSLIPAAARG